MELKDDGVFILLAVANPDSDIHDIEEKILQEIEKIKSQDISKDEIEKIKINTKREFLHSIESSSALSDMLGGYIAKGDIKPLLEYEENLGKITPKMLSDVAKKYFINSQSTTLIMKKD